MFLKFYGLREQPFGVTPEPRFLYLSPCHREALASLVYGIEAGRGFLALIARPGMGKTTLVFQLLERLKDPAKKVFLFQTQCNSREFVRYVLSDLGLETSENDLLRLHQELNEVVTNELRAGKRLVLFVDEAQNLDDSVLETIRLLSNLETPNEKLLQIILSGQPQLADKLAQPGLEQLRQRVSMIGRLEPFSPQETRNYIHHRLRVAGYRGGELFTPDALDLIAAHSGGIPRNINNLCFNALSLGYGLGRKTIPRSVLEEVIADLDVPSIVPGPDEPLPVIGAPSPSVVPQPVRRPGVVGDYARAARAWLIRRQSWALASVIFATLAALAWTLAAHRETISSEPQKVISRQQKSSVISPQAPQRANRAPSSQLRPGSTGPPRAEGSSGPASLPLPEPHALARRGEPAAPNNTPPPSAADSHGTDDAENPAEISPEREVGTRKKISALRKRGDLYMNRGEYNKAIRDFQAALDLDPLNVDLFLRLERARKAKATEEQVLR